MNISFELKIWESHKEIKHKNWTFNFGTYVGSFIMFGEIVRIYYNDDIFYEGGCDVWTEKEKIFLKTVQWVDLVPFDKLPLYVNHEDFLIRKCVNKRLEVGTNIGVFNFLNTLLWRFLWRKPPYKKPSILLLPPRF